MQHVALEVSAPFACFTRPEMKVERVSYDVITPSAARNVFTAILWRPAIRWQIEAIEVLAPIRWVNLRRNEVGSVVPVNAVRAAQKAGRGHLGLYVEDDRQQRAGLFLRDVAYRLHARFELTDRAGPDDNLEKFSHMFRRRAEKGQCFHQPYLGCREFACDFGLPPDDPTTWRPAIEESRDLGFLLYDFDYADPAAPRPLFFRARLDQGRVRVPEGSSPEVLG